MMRFALRCSTLLAFVALSGCSWFRDDCPAGNCDGGELLDNRPAIVYWYCYGTETQEWQCQHEPDAALIHAQ